MDFDIELAWSRVKKDLKERHFISPIFLPEILDSNISTWLNLLKVKFNSGKHVPSGMDIVEIPKGNGLIRPGSLLTIEDNLYYSCLVQECYQLVLEQIMWSQNTIDFSYIVSEEHIKSKEWYKNAFEGWSTFRNHSIDILSKGSQHVVITDLTGFYDNIDISTLISDLRACKVPQEITNQLSKCLNRWSIVAGKGIPQGNSASDLLAKLYLNPIDHGMVDSGYCFRRYVDDIRIFCGNKSKAKRALLELTKMLRKRGLNLQSSKTEIYNSQSAYNEIEGVQPVINVIVEKLQKERDVLKNLSLSAQEITAISDDGDDTPLEAIKETFVTYFIDGSDQAFDRTLFHYLINKLIRAKVSLALTYCLSILDKHPEETPYILKYSEALDDIWDSSLKEMMSLELLKFMKSKEAVYDFQNYLILQWFAQNPDFVTDSLISLTRSFSFDNNRPYYLRSIARVILGDHGNPADFERLEALVYGPINEFEKAETLCCLRKLEKGRKGSLLGRLATESPLLEMTVKFVKDAK